MPCCRAEVVLRRSLRGTQFFAHKAIGNCTTAPESETHLRLKQIAVEVARSFEWDAETEVAGASPQGECWTADVLATKGNRKIAIEIQWSAQTDEETFRRQRRYAESGVRCLWLFRQKRFPNVFDVPGAHLEGTVECGLMATLRSSAFSQSLPVTEFLTAVFRKRLKFGIAIGTPTDIQIRVGETECWRCHREIEIVTGIDVKVGPHSFEFSASDLTDFPDLHGTIARHVGPFRPLSAIKIRHSRTQARRYLSNGCSYCNALFGEFYEYSARERERVAKHFSIAINKRWLCLIQECGYETGGWALF